MYIYIYIYTHTYILQAYLNEMLVAFLLGLSNLTSTVDLMLFI